MKAVLLAVAFCLELVAFAGFSLLAYLLPIHPLLQLGTAVLLLWLIAWFWSTYMSPKAKRELHGKAFYCAQALVYVLASVGLLFKLGAIIGVLFIIIYIVDEVLIHITIFKSK